MDGLCRRARSCNVVALITVGAALVASGCSSKQRLGEYDFRGRTLAVVTVAPPHPEILTGAYPDVKADNPVEAVLRAGAEIAREAGAYRMRARLDSAAAAVDVSGRMADRTLRNAARHLRAEPVTGTPRVDYELEVRIRRYGIVANSWTAGAYFSIDADIHLLDGGSGRRIWKTRVRASDPVRPSALGIQDRSVTNVVTAVALASMSTAEIQRALESLADFAADRVVERLAESLDDARN